MQSGPSILVHLGHCVDPMRQVLQQLGLQTNQTKSSRFGNYPLEMRILLGCYPLLSSFVSLSCLLFTSCETLKTQMVPTMPTGLGAEVASLVDAVCGANYCFTSPSRIQHIDELLDPLFIAHSVPMLNQNVKGFPRNLDGNG